MSNIEELRQQLADVSHERDLLRAAQQWVKCGDRMPEDGKKVIVWVSRLGYYPDYIECAHRQGGKWNAHEGNCQSITHWKSMPDGPSTEKKS